MLILILILFFMIYSKFDFIFFDIFHIVSYFSFFNFWQILSRCETPYVRMLSRGGSLKKLAKRCGVTTDRLPSADTTPESRDVP